MEEKVKKTIFILTIFFISVFLSADQIIPLPGVINPQGEIYFFKDYMYIPQMHNILIYSLKDYKFIKSFGKKGEGPGEFRFYPDLKAYDDCLVIQDFNKLIFFNPLGELIKEIKKPGQVRIIESVPDGYLCRGTRYDQNTSEEWVEFYLYNKELKDKKILSTYLEDTLTYNQTAGTTVLKVPSERILAQVYKGRVFIGNSKKGLFFEVFNLKGNKLYEFNKDFEKVRISKQYQNGYIKYEKVTSRNRKRKTQLKFSSYFPAFQYFRIKDDHIILILFSPQYPPKSITQVYLDLKGNLIKRVTKVLPEKIKRKNRVIRAWGIYQNKNYEIVENEEEELWELHVSDLTDGSDG